MLQNRGRHPGFSDACLAGEQHDLAFTRLCPEPAAEKQFDLFFPPDKGCEAGRMQRVKAALHGTRPQRRPGSRRPGDALEVPGSEIPELEEIAEKLPGALRD